MNRQACENFLKAGFTDVVNIEGGTMACLDVDLPVVRGKKAISLERQVRIAAGLSTEPRKPFVFVTLLRGESTTSLSTS